MTDWQTRLRAAGYTGELELGAMVRACGEDFLAVQKVKGNPAESRWRAVAESSARLKNVDGSWRGGIADCYAWEPEEAVANLMIEHPELWRGAAGCDHDFEGYRRPDGALGGTCRKCGFNAPDLYPAARK
jgi:hypothetical protein